MVGPETDYEALLRARADIQQDLLTLLRLVRDRRHALMAADQRTVLGVFALLVGGAFSLWRAAFLTDIMREWPDILDKAEYLLDELLKTNAAPFSVEHKAKEWIFGYYLNNAIYRLAEVRRRLPDVDPTPALSAFDELAQGGGLIGTTMKPTELWRIVHDAHRELTVTLLQRV
jgi:hypothetical protein